MSVKPFVVSSGRGRHVLLGLLLLPWVVSISRAGTISMQVGCQAQETNLVVRIENRGDEAARNVYAHVQFNGTETQTSPILEFQPNTPVGTLVVLQRPAMTGIYPAVVTVFFEDLNGYPFSSVTVQAIPFGDVNQARISAALDGRRVRGKGTLKLRLRNQGEQDVTTRVRMITAREIIAEPPEGDIVIPAGQVHSLPIPIENFSALPGSHYPVHAILEYEADGYHFTSGASTVVNMLQPRPYGAKSFWVVLVVLVGAIAVSFWRLRKK